ncbi:MAG: hypothetical protein ACUVV3_05035 [Dehalococcoidia bacterium]
MRLRLMLGLGILVLALALAACGGDEEEAPAGGEGETTPAATKTVEPAETPAARETPSGGGEVTLGDVPVYPGAEKVGDFSGSFPVPMVGEELDIEEYKYTEWAIYKTSDSLDDVANFYKDKMPDKGWEEQSWFGTSMVDGAAWGGYTRDDGDVAAWVYISTNDKTEIVIGTGSR